MSRISSLVAQADDLHTEPVSCPEWGVTINVRSMDGNGRSAFMQRLADARENGEAVASIETDLLVACCFDPEDDSQCFVADDIPMLLTKSGAVIGRLSAVAMRQSGLDAKAEERLGKDSSASTATSNDGSTSISPAS